MVDDEKRFEAESKNTQHGAQSRSETQHITDEEEVLARTSRQGETVADIADEEQALGHTPIKDETAAESDQTLDSESHRTSFEGDGRNGDGDGHEIAPHASNVSSVWVSQGMSTWKEVLFLTTVCLTNFCLQASFSSTLLLLNVIGSTWDVTDVGQLSWLVAAFSLTAGTFLIFSGRLGDAFGYKLMLMLGFAWFALWSIIAGLAVYSSYLLFVFARALQGCGAAVCLPNALAIIGAAYPAEDPKKALAFAIFGATAPTGAVVGAAVGSALAMAWWPWVFWVLGIVLTGFVILTYLVVPPMTTRIEKFTSFADASRKLDLIGAALGISGLILFNFAWNQAPQVGWDVPQTIVTLILGAALFAAFILYESRFAENPLLPLDALNVTTCMVLGVVACGWATFGIFSLYFIQVLERIRGLSPILTAAWLSPVFIFGALASITTGIMLGKLKLRPSLVMTLSLMSFLTGITLFATAPTDQIYWGQTFVTTVVIPFGMDMSFPAATLILSNAVKKAHQGIAASLVATVVNYSISLGLGFAGTVEVHVNNGGRTPEDVLAGFRGAMYLGIGLSGLGLLICLGFLASDLISDRSRPQRSRGEKTETA